MSIHETLNGTVEIKYRTDVWHKKKLIDKNIHELENVLLQEYNSVSKRKKDKIKLLSYDELIEEGI